MERIHDGNCTLCLRKCLKNAVEGVSCERFHEAVQFVFTFKVKYNFESNKWKVCCRCLNFIMKFYEYAAQVKINQEFLEKMETDVGKVEPATESTYPIQVLQHEAVLGLVDSASVHSNIVQEESNSLNKEDEETISDRVDTIEIARTERRRRKKRKKDTYRCTRCSESFSEKTMLIMHMIKHLDCKVCGALFSDRASLLEHTKAMHKSDGRVMCEKCGKIFSKCSLKTHYETRHSTGPVDTWQCHFCSQIFYNPATMRSHIQAIHKEADRVFKCDVCQQIYPTSRSLRGHKARVHIEKKYCCNICKKQFKLVVNFKEHMAAHTGAVLYECDVCNQKFNSNANMYVHIKRKHPVEWNEKQKHRHLGRRRLVDKDLI